MKRITVSIALIFLVISLTFSTNLQKIYTTRDDVYKRVSALCMRSDVIGPSSSSPLSAKALMIALDRINPDNLEEQDKAEYDELYSILTEENYILKTESFSLDMDLGVNLGVNIADYSDFDYGNTKKAEPDYDRRENTIVPYRYQDGLLSAGVRMNFGDYINLDARFDLKNPNDAMFESTLGFLVTSVTDKRGIAAEWPFRAGASIGNDYVSFIFGRFPHSIGNGITGNLLIGDNFDYQEVTALSFMSNYFTYNISVTRFDLQSLEGNHHFVRNKFLGEQQVRVNHRFDINILDKARFVLNLGTMFKSSSFFDIRFFYPFMITHNYNDYNSGVNRTSYDEANNILSVEIEWNIAEGFLTTAQVVVDQFQMPWEDWSSLPLAFGVLWNLKHSMRLEQGTLNSWIEAVYTNPYLYLNAKYFMDGETELIDYNLDHIVGYNTIWLDDYGYSGYVHGPDSIVFSVGSSYIANEDKFEIGGNLLYKISGNKGIKHKVNGSYNTSIDMNDAVIEKTPEEYMKNIVSPSGGWKTAEHLFKLALYGIYNINGTSWGNVSIYSAFGFNTYFNYCHKLGDVEFQPQLLIGAKYLY